MTLRHNHWCNNVMRIIYGMEMNSIWIFFLFLTIIFARIFASKEKASNISRTIVFHTFFSMWKSFIVDWFSFVCIRRAALLECFWQHLNAYFRRLIQYVSVECHVYLSLRRNAQRLRRSRKLLPSSFIGIGNGLDRSLRCKRNAAQ